MAHRFRCYVFDRNNRVLTSLDLIAPDKLGAAIRARAELKEHDQAHSFELWQNAKRVKKEHAAEWTLAEKEKKPARQTTRSHRTLSEPAV